MRSTLADDAPDFRFRSISTSVTAEAPMTMPRHGGCNRELRPAVRIWPPRLDSAAPGEQASSMPLPVIAAAVAPWLRIRRGKELGEGVDLRPERAVR